MSEELLKMLQSGGTGLAELVKNGTTVLMDEVIKLYIFFGVMGVIKAAVVFVVFGVVMKLLNTYEKADSEGKSSNKIKSMKVVALIISLVYFTANSFPHILDIGKAVVAPNLFIAEKGLELIKVIPEKEKK